MNNSTSTRRSWRSPRLLALGLPAALLGQCAPTQCAPAPAPVTYTVTKVVDGDTVDVAGTDGSHPRIRLIGIDTPETGSCEAAKATSALSGLVAGKTVALTSGARDNADRYGRLLRYVDAGGADAGKRLIDSGLAIARYDGRDGYGEHPRQAAYVQRRRRVAGVRLLSRASSRRQRQRLLRQLRRRAGGGQGSAPPWATRLRDAAARPRRRRRRLRVGVARTRRQGRCHAGAMPGSDPKTDLHHYLRVAREALLWKLDGLSDYDVRRPLVPTGTNLLGLVKHVASVEAGYFGDTFGRPLPEQLPWTEDGAEPNADMWATADESRDDVVGLYRRVSAHSDVTIETLDLDAIGHVPWWGDQGEVTLHAILVHMLAETNRHAGHADIVRELVDGAAGLRDGNDNMPAGDAAWWDDYRDRLERVAREAGER